MDQARPPLSVLDLAVVNEGGTSAEALAATTALAQRADALGYLRFWVAEHHNMALVASTTPPVLMAHLAARTDRIRIGSGGIMLPNHAPLVVAEPPGPSYVSRGGHKLVGALEAFGYDPAGKRVLDAGASTGGFTDVLLQRGAAHVVAVDVGYGQLAWSLQTDARVTVVDRSNVM